MLKKKIKKLLISAVLMGVLFLSCLLPNTAKANTYLSNNVTQTQQYQMTVNDENESVCYKGRILIYSTHTCEKNLDSNVTSVAEDLSRKLRSKGFFVEHITNNFSTNYNNSYYSSRSMLNTKDLKSYDLVLDLHFDASDNPITTKINGKDVSSLMFVTVSQNPNLQQETDMIKGIKNRLNEFSTTMVRDQTTHYKVGISYYNADLCDNMLLVEMGGNNNTYLQCQYSNTYLCSAINSYLSNR